MKRVQKVATFVTALLILAAITGLIGCSHGSGATAPPANQDITANSNPPLSITEDSNALGYFQFVFDDDGTVKVEGTDTFRGAEINVTPFVSIVLEDFWWDETTRDWHIIVGLKNISIFTGYDVWVVLHSLGPKMVANPDGYTWILPPIFPEPKRCTFVAYGKGNVNRAFPPGFYDAREIIFHQPEGVPKLAPIGFWIDATGVPRRNPGVENPHLTTSDETHYHLTAFIWDHQSPSSDLTAWADTSGFNGNTYTQLFDDGAHGDGASGDNIFGCDFVGDPVDGWYWATIYAFDPDQNQGENDAWFYHGQQVPCDKPMEPVPYNVLDHGEMSGITYPYEVVVTNPDEWMNVWMQHSSIFFPPPPPPPVDFTAQNVVGIWVGSRPTNNHMVHVTDVLFDPCEFIVTVYYDYTPNIGCGPLDVVTNPYEMILLPKFEWPIIFVGTEVDCPPPPPECVEPILFETVLSGINSGIQYPYEKKITNMEDFNALWQEHISIFDPAPPAPEINFQCYDLYAVGLGNRPTGGFACEIYNMCWMSDQSGGAQSIGVFYKELIPGPDCNVYMIVTQPFHWVLTQKTDAPIHWFPSQEVYSCPPCNEVPSYQLADNQWGCAEPGEYGFAGFNDEFEKLWYALNCWTPESGTDPPPLPAIPDPTEPGWENKPFAIQLGERQTSGFFLTLDYVCLDGCTAVVHYTENTPGPNCPTEDVITKPWLFGVAEFPPIDCIINWEFVKTESVYECPGDCQPVIFTETANGQHGCADTGEYGFQYMEDYHQFWFDVNCWDPESGTDPPPLPTDVLNDPNNVMNHIGIQLGERPSTGYSLTINQVCIKGCDVYVEYTENIPGPDCDVLWVTTRPWIVASVEMPPVYCYWTWHFTKNEVIYNCNEPPDCWDFEAIAGGPQGPHETGGWFFDSYADYSAYWHEYHQGQSMPPVDWQGGYGAYAIHLGERPTSGYEVSVYEICKSDNPDGTFGAAVRWYEWIPGETCAVEPVLTYPWTLVTFPLVDLPYFDQGFEKIYQCD
ncbi:MAG: protease complex subunit PrcB family protein [bacterium]|nr:protease complex subunit PrcB family protein [bacterium]